jgi:hypothetical protein
LLSNRPSGSWFGGWIDRAGRQDDVSQARRTIRSETDPTSETAVTPELAAILRRAERAGIDPRRVAVALGLPYTTLRESQQAPSDSGARRRGR